MRNLAENANSCSRISAAISSCTGAGPAPGDGNPRLLTSVTTGANQLMTSVNRRIAGRVVPSPAARLLLEFTRICAPLRGSLLGYTGHLLGSTRIYAYFFAAIWGVFGVIMRTFDRFLPGKRTDFGAGGRPPGVRNLYGNVRFLYGFCTVLDGKCRIYGPEKGHNGSPDGLKPA